MPELTRQGFPWPQDQDVFHATASVDNILTEGFLTREQGAPAALGGSWNKSVSFTLSLPRAASIAIGLDTLVKGANKIISCVELLERLAIEVPTGIQQAIYSGFNLSDITHFYDDFESRFNALAYALTYIDRGWDYYKIYPLDPLPQFRQSIRVGPMSWLISPSDVKNLRHLEGADYRGQNYLSVFYELYRSTLSYAKQEAFNPIWVLSDLEVLRTKKFSSVGILISKLHIPFVCTDADGSLRLGYLDGADLNPVIRSTLDQAEHSCRSALSVGDSLFESPIDSYDARWGLSSLDTKYWREQRIGRWDIRDTGERRRSTTMLFHDREEELIVFDPSKIQVVEVLSVRELRNLFKIENRVTFPWFDDRAVDVRVTPPV